jgi:hypothetical protein
MVSILDIGPLTEDVEIAGTKIPVNGISARAVFGLLLNYPQLRRVFAQKGLDGDMVQELVARAPETLAEIIASGLGHPDEEDYIKWAGNRSIGEQYDLLAAIFRLTFPKGPKSFLDGLQNAMASVGGPGWDQATKSQEASSAVSAPDTESKTAGDTPRDNSPAGAS